MPKTPTQWTPETNQPSGFTPYGSLNPTVLTNNDSGAPTQWANADTKNQTAYTPSSKNPTSFNQTFGITTFTYDTLGAIYSDPTITYSQTQQNQSTPALLDTAWSPT